MRIFVVDDHEVVRAGLRYLLPSCDNLEVIGEASTGQSALRDLRRFLPDVVCTEFRLPDMCGDELCREIRTRFPSTAVLFLTAYLSEDLVQRSLDAGAAGFVTKAAGMDQLRAALADAAEGGGTCLTGGAAGIVRRLYDRAPSRAGRLTPRQERVLELIAQGKTYGEISRLLHVSESTVRFHTQSLKARLGVRTRTELVSLAIRSALIAPDGYATAA